MNNNIHVINSPTGSGKTSYIMNYINQSSNDKKFIVITPLLDEVTRYIERCPNKHFLQPQVIWKENNVVETKSQHLIELVSRGVNIVSTHALLKRITDELITLLRNSHYTLILDEAFQVVDQFDLYPEKNKEGQSNELTKEDVQWLINDKYIEIDDMYLIKWVDENRIVGNKYSELKSLIDRGMVYLVNDSLFLWTFPYELFSDNIFEECYVLTYMFKSQFQYYYYEYFNIEYDQYHIETINNEYQLIQTVNNNYEIEFKQKAKELITIINDEGLNKIGSFYKGIGGKLKTTDLSMNWYRKNKNLLKQLNNNLYNYFRNFSYVAIDNRLWTSFVEYKNKLTNPLTGKRTFIKEKDRPKITFDMNEEEKSEVLEQRKKIDEYNLKVTFLDLSSRATNSFRHKTSLAYLINRYPNTFYVSFFKKRGKDIDSDLYALGDLIQWVWRSAVRDGKPIMLYLPSQRMQIIFNDFLNNNDISEFEDVDYEE